ncbi:MAG: pentapeptide repeat-containing protein [Acetatifactor sp.]
MEREAALQSYREKVSGKIADFRSNMEKYLMEHAGYLEDMVKSGMDRLGDQMKKQEKEYVCFLYISVLKTDLINRNYRIFLHGLDMSWYLDDEPVEAYVDAEELFQPFENLRNMLEEANNGYGGAISVYDIQNLLFEELSLVNSMICQILRYRLRDWEVKGIFDQVVRSPYWLLKWGEYRDKSEFLIQVDRVEKSDSAWKEELAKAAHNPEKMIFSYWYKGHCQGKNPQNLDMRFITFEECFIQDIKFNHCNMEGSRFPKSKINGCRFEGCDLSGADFRDCSFENTSFAGTELMSAIFPAESLPFLDISAEQLQVIHVYRGE